MFLGAGTPLLGFLPLALCDRDEWVHIRRCVSSRAASPQHCLFTTSQPLHTAIVLLLGLSMLAFCLAAAVPQKVSAPSFKASSQANQPRQAHDQT